MNGESVGFFVVFFGSDGIASRFSYYVLFEDIVESWKHVWNNYPEKQPPYNVPLMVEWEREAHDGTFTQNDCVRNTSRI